jgi:hypothetical protein
MLSSITKKGGDCKCIWPPKWVLMIMTRTIKGLMCLLSYEQDLKSLELKEQVSTLNSLKERCMSFIEEFH